MKICGAIEKQLKKSRLSQKPEEENKPENHNSFKNLFFKKTKQQQPQGYDIKRRKEKEELFISKRNRLNENEQEKYQLFIRGDSQ